MDAKRQKIEPGTLNGEEKEELKVLLSKPEVGRSSISAARIWVFDRKEKAESVMKIIVRHIMELEKTKDAKLLKRVFFIINDVMLNEAAESSNNFAKAVEPYLVLFGGTIRSVMQDQAGAWAQGIEKWTSLVEPARKALAAKMRGEEYVMEARSATAATTATTTATTSTSTDLVHTTGAVKGDRLSRKQHNARPVPSQKGGVAPATAEGTVPEMSTGLIFNRRPPGRAGVVRATATNFFRVNLLQETIYQYAVHFVPELPLDMVLERKQLLNTVFGKPLREACEFYHFTNTTLLCSKPIPDERENKTEKMALMTLFDPEAEKTLEIWGFKSEQYRCRPVSPSSAKTSKEFQILLGMLAKRHLRERFQESQGWFYHHSYQQLEGGFNLSLLPGFEASVHPTISGSQLCVDLRSRVVQMKRVRDIMEEAKAMVLQNFSNLSHKEMEVIYQKDCLARLRGRKVQSLGSQQMWRVDDIDFSVNPSSSFVHRDGKSWTHVQWMSKYYPKMDAIPSHFLSEPGLLVHFRKARRGAKKEGDQPTPIYLVPDQYFPTGMNDEMRSNRRVMTAVAKTTRLPPSSRVREIQEMLERIKTAPKLPTRRDREREQQKDSKEPVQPDLKPREPMLAPPVRFGPDLTVVSGRVLPGFAVRTQDGVSTMLHDRKDFSRPINERGIYMTTDDTTASIDAWAFISPVAGQKDAADFMFKLYQSGSKGVKFSEERPMSYHVDDRNFNEWHETLRNAVETLGSMYADRPRANRVLVVFLSSEDSKKYSAVKEMCAVRFGVVSQCVIMATTRPGAKLRSIVDNTMRQIVNKLGYLSWTIALHDEKTDFSRINQPLMFVGIDVNNTGKIKGTVGADREPCATYSMCASFNKDYNAFNSFVMFQSRSEGVNTPAKKCMTAALQAFYDKNKIFPSMVVVYRDGVSDSQMHGEKSYTCLEIEAFELAAQELGQNIKWTFIVCQTGVSARFFDPCPKVGCREKNCTGNESHHSPLPGTVVDVDITAQDYIDFYLVPSSAPPGACARPTRFIVLKDDLNLSMDALQIMTNQLCYMYTNWTGPIRVPAPVKYAHRLGHMFAKYLNGQRHDNLKNKLFFI